MPRRPVPHCLRRSEVVGVERDGRDWAVSARRTGTEGKEVLAWRCSELLVATGKSAYPAMPGELQACQN